MALIIPYTFVAGTKAKAAEVNADFQAVAQEVNSQGGIITSVQSAVTNLQNNKAEVNGNSSNRFSVATPVNSYDAVNKIYLTDLTKYLLVGLQLKKDDDDYIGCSRGATYDKTYSKILKFDADVSKQNTNQTANATYYVYIEGSADGTTTDLLISLSSDNPALDSGFALYQYLGYYTTDDDGNISNVYSAAPASGTELEKLQLNTAGLPNYGAGISKAWNTQHTAEQNGWIFIAGNLIDSSANLIATINGVQFVVCRPAPGTTSSGMGLFPVKKGDTYRGSGAYNVQELKFYPNM